MGSCISGQTLETVTTIFSTFIHISLIELYTCFCEFDIFGNGNIDPFSIKHVSNFTGRKISEEDAKEIIGIMDETGMLFSQSLVS